MHLSFTSQEVWRIRDLGDRFLWIGLRQIFDWPPRLHLNSLVDQEHLRGVKSRQFWKTGLRLHHVTVESPSRHSLHLSHLKSVHVYRSFVIISLEFNLLHSQARLLQSLLLGGCGDFALILVYQTNKLNSPGTCVSLFAIPGLCPGASRIK